MPNSPPTTGGIINKGITAHQNINTIKTRRNSGSNKAASTNVQVLEKVSKLSGAEHVPLKESTPRATMYRNADRTRARSNKMPAKTYLIIFVLADITYLPIKAHTQNTEHIASAGVYMASTLFPPNRLFYQFQYR